MNYMDIAHSGVSHVVKKGHFEGKKAFNPLKEHLALVGATFQNTCGDNSLEKDL